AAADDELGRELRAREEALDEEGRARIEAASAAVRDRPAVVPGEAAGDALAQHANGLLQLVRPVDSPDEVAREAVQRLQHRGEADALGGEHAVLLRRDEREGRRREPGAAADLAAGVLVPRTAETLERRVREGEPARRVGRRDGEPVVAGEERDESP